MNTHEEGLINAFVEPSRRERFLSFLSKSKMRRKFRDELYHRKSRFLIPKFLTPVTGNNRRIPELYSLLRRMGSPEVCWVVGGRFDAQEVRLIDALNASEDGVIVSCIPGKLAYFKSEDEEYILSR